MSENLLFSIIIPIYNGSATIKTCLDSIYSQELDNNLFEVVCVDDDSTDGATVVMLEHYVYKKNKPTNFRIFRHQVNKKRGGACNTGINYAKGQWIVYIDCDDYFLDDGLKKLFQLLNANESLDMLIYNYSTARNLRCIDNLVQDEMNGAQFIQSQPVPWVSWCYAFKKSFVIKNNLKYEENVFFEDCDYVIKAVTLASRIKFIDIPILYYSVYDGQTSTINTFQKVEDLLRLSVRLKNFGLQMLSTNIKIGNAVMNHHWYHYCVIVKQYLWRFSPNEIYHLLIQYKPYDKGRGWVRLVPKYPLVYTGVAFIMKPFLLIASKIYRRMKY